MYLCIDIGGTKTLLAIFTKRGHKLLTKRFPTNHEPKKFIQDLKNRTKHFQNIKDINIAVPGEIKKSGIKYGNLEKWNGFDLKKSLEAVFKDATINLINDADAAALYEGSFYPYDKVLYLTFSTGIGAGLVEEGQLSQKSAHLEPGHKKYPFKGQVKEWEDIAAASAIREVYGQPVSTLKDQAIFNDIAVRLSLGFTDLIKKHQPNIIIFGGPLARQLPRFSRPLRKLLAESLPSDLEIPRFLRARRPTESVIYGLYIYGKQAEQK